MSSSVNVSRSEPSEDSPPSRVSAREALIAAAEKVSDRFYLEKVAKKITHLSFFVHLKNILRPDLLPRWLLHWSL